MHAKGKDAVRVADKHGVFVGHVAREQEAPLRSLLELRDAKNIKVRARFIRSEREALNANVLALHLSD